MRNRPATLSLSALGALVLAIGACGSQDEADGAGTSASVASAPATTTIQATAETPTATASSTPATAAATGKLALKKVGSFVSPVYLTSPPGDTSHQFVVEQAGRIRVIAGGRTLAKPFLDIRSLVTAGGEQGLLSVAFAPDYAKSGRFYVYYTDKQQQQRVVEYRRATAVTANPKSARLVLKMADPEPNHNGGLLKFGPDDLLYIGTGDGGGADDQHGARGNAQNLASPLGKLLRINPKASGGEPYTIPAGNPFAKRSGVRKEIYSYGLRNPWRYSFDRSTGALVIGDVGQGKIEEVDYRDEGEGNGANFGWRPFEGTSRHSPGESAPGAINPVLQLSHSDGYCSITGGYVVRDKTLPASIQGEYLYSDFCKSDIRAVKLSTSGATGDHKLSLSKVASVSSFGEDAQGRIYVVTLGGPIYRLVAE